MTQVPDWIATGKCQTRDGREVRIYATDAGGTFPVHGAAFDKSAGEWLTKTWCASGQFHLEYCPDFNDLIPIPKEPVVTKERILVEGFQEVLEFSGFISQALENAEVTRAPDTNKILKVHWEAE